jgi:myo-inositol-1(or 4)-monophosphatase
MSEFVEVAELAARRAGSLLKSMVGRVDIREKGPRDLVTEADLEAQRLIRETLLTAFPDHAFVGEEQQEPAAERSGKLSSEFCWVVDPLDGTTNFAHQLPMYGVSIALCRSGRLVAGVVYDPSLDEMFRAAEGEKPIVNGRTLSVSGCESLSTGLVAASFSANVPRGSQEIARFIEVLHACRAVRRMGSAALNLCYLAAGRLDAYWASSVKTWDVAAGVLLVEQAGGVVTALDGSKLDLERPAFAAAATPQLHAELLETLGRAGV